MSSTLGAVVTANGRFHFPQLKKELVHSVQDAVSLYVYRQSNQVLLVKDGDRKRCNMDQLEDKYGHRYYRDIDAEKYAYNCWVYRII